MRALTQQEVENILNEYRRQSQAVREKLFDVVLNSGGCISLDDVYNMDLQDFNLLKKNIIEMIEIKNKNHLKSLNLVSGKR